MVTWNPNLMANMAACFGESIPSSPLVKYKASPLESLVAFLD